MRSYITIHVTVMAILLIFGPAFAQTDPPHDGPPFQKCPVSATPCYDFAWLDTPDSNEPIPPPGGMRPGEGPHGGDRRGFERLRMAKLAELLQLKEDQKEPFIEAFRKMRSRQRQIEQQRKQLLDELSQMLKSDRIDEKGLVAKTDQLVALERDRFAVMDNLFQAARTILTPVQVAKMALFQERFEAAAMRMTREFMHRQGGPGRPNMPMPPDSFDGRP